MTPLICDTATARVRTVANSEVAAELAAGLIDEALRRGIGERGVGGLAVSGGRSPISTFAALTRRDIEWSKVCITLVDERWVEPHLPESNERLVREHLVLGPVRNVRFVPMKSPSISPLAGIGRHIQAMHTLPALDAALLRMGEDGHFASLFPRSPALAIGLDVTSASSCVAVPVGSNGGAPDLPRLSLTLGRIAKARSVILLSSGAAKLAVLQQVLSSVCNPAQLPVAALLAARPDTVILQSAA